MEWNVFIYPALMVVGALLGSLTNWFVDRSCLVLRFRSPWRILPAEFLERFNGQAPTGRDEPFVKSWLDFVPIFGWLSLKRLGPRLAAMPEADRLPGLETSRFWIRPFLVELLSALGVAGLFWWEVRRQMLLPGNLTQEPYETVLLRFGVHVLFLAILLAATLTDFDDMIIPDSLTVPGTILGILLAVTVPQTLLPSMEIRTELALSAHATDSNPLAGSEFVFSIDPDAVPLNVNSPNPSVTLWKSDVGNNIPRYWGLLSGLWIFWCFAMLDRVWYARLSFGKARRIFCRYLVRSRTTKWWVAAALAGPIALWALFAFNPSLAGSDRHLGLLSALVGMAVGMAIVWGVRIVGGAVLGREAMGFGDVTLMGMVGAFVGWQSCLLIFFFAPILGLLIILFGRILLPAPSEEEQGPEFPFGPSLCLATTILVFGWGSIWLNTSVYFELGWKFLALVMLVCLVLLALLLGIWRWIRAKIFGF